MAKKTLPQTSLKQLPTVDTSTRALVVEGHDYIVGRRRAKLPYALIADWQAAQAEVRKAAPSAADMTEITAHQQRIKAEDATDEDRAAAAAVFERMTAKQLAHRDTIQHANAMTAQLINAAIVSWNLDEYARLDGQSFSPAGHIAADDIAYAPTELIEALIEAVTKGDQAAEKKSAAPSTNS